jgi:hypothetical protein
VLNISSWEFSLRVVPPSFGTETAYRMGGLMNNFLNDFCTTWHLPNLGGAKVWMILVAHISANIYEACRFCTGAIFLPKNAGDTHLLHVMSMNVYECSWFIMFHDAFFGPTLELLWLRKFGHFPRSQASCLDLIPSTCRLASEGFAIGVFKSNPHIWVFKGPHHYQISK